MRYAVIMAGGSGKRLWPLSRRNYPKQLLPLIDGNSLIEIAVGRLRGMFEPENILIVTNAEYADKIAEVLPDIPAANIIPEPEGRDTANAIALAAALLNAKDSSGTMAVFTADHVIRPVDCFVNTVEAAMVAAEANPDTLLTFGIKPTWPHTGLGYIEIDQKLDDSVWKVVSFREKPDHAQARKFVESGQFFWNSGMFVWTISTITNVMKQYLPASVDKLAPVGAAAASGEDYTKLLSEIYPTLEKISIDYAIMEKAQSVMMVQLNTEWIDLGSWPSLEDVADLDDKGNAIIAKNHVVIDSLRNVLVSSDDNHLLAVMGVDDCIVVHSPDATLVCKKSDHQRLKDIVAAIEKDYGPEYL
jgi:mannose-1-phosphate guanylyltransferase